MNQHNGDKPYKCEQCEKAFSKRIQLRQHRLSHGLNKHTCPICGVSFNRRGNMNTHMKRHNKDDGMYTCSVSVLQIIHRHPQYKTLLQIFNKITLSLFSVSNRCNIYCYLNI